MSGDQVKGPPADPDVVQRYGAHEIVWDKKTGDGKCRVCGRRVSKIEIGDDRNKDCDGTPRFQGRAR